MKTTLRKIGNSRGILIPAPFIAACGLVDEVEVTIEAGTIVVSPIRRPRENWFDSNTSVKDAPAWPSHSLSDVSDWEW
jgi:antitoxin MazE